MEDITLDYHRNASRYSGKISQNIHVGNASGIVMTQPSREDYQNERISSPVAVLEVTNVGNIPLRNGLDILQDATELIIQQNVGVSDLEHVSSENRYTIKIPRGDTIGYATESSDNWQRICFGSGRSFSLRLYDKSQREVLFFRRRLACGKCTFWCYLQKMEVWISPGELVGTVSQTTTLGLKTRFNICDRQDNVVYVIEGPSSFGCLLGKSQHFQIFNIGSTKVGSIVYQWDQLQVSNYLLLKMPENRHSNEHRALLLGSAFLLEYMFFEGLQKKSCGGCLC